MATTKKKATSTPKKAVVKNAAEKPTDPPEGEVLLAPKTLQITIEHEDRADGSDAGRVNVLWTVLGAVDAPQFSPYFVDEDSLREVGATIREILSDLQALGLSAEASAVRPILMRLARAGTRLYEALFAGLMDKYGSRTAAAEIKTWFEDTVVQAAPGSWRIQMVHSKFSKAIVPWGLTYTPRVPFDAELGLAVADWRDFWCISFNLACRGAAQASSDRIPPHRETDSVKVAVVMEIDETVTETYAQQSSIERGAGSNRDSGMRAADRETQHDLVRSSKEGYQQLAEDYQKRDVYWYISLHADGGSHLLGDEPVRESDLFNPRRGNKNQIIFMMLDGDAVMRKDRGSGWVETALRLGSAGLIAVETDIKNEELRFFGWQILKFILRNKKPFYLAMQEARAEFWPRSLLYGVYCNPIHVYVDPPPEHDIRRIDDFIAFRKMRRSQNSDEESGQ